jgi:hypothetical protein
MHTLVFCLSWLCFTILIICTEMSNIKESVAKFRVHTSLVLRPSCLPERAGVNKKYVDQK